MNEKTFYKIDTRSSEIAE